MNRWNSLLQRAVEAGSLSMFKAEVDRFLISKGIKGLFIIYLLVTSEALTLQ